MLSCNNMSFGPGIVTVNKTGGLLTVGSDCSLPLGANPTVTYMAISSTFTLQGTLSGSGDLTFVGNGGGLILAAATDWSGFNNVTVGIDLTVNSGASITAPGAAAPNGVLTFQDSLTLPSSNSFNANGGTVTFSGTSATISCGGATFNSVRPVTINKGTGAFTIGSDCTLPIGSGPVNWGSSNTFTLNGALTGSGSLQINSNAGTLVIGGTSDWSQFSNVTIAGPNLQVGASGVFTTPSTKLTLQKGLTISSGGVFNATPSGSVEFTTGGNVNLDCGSANLGAVTLNKNAAGNTVTLTHDCAVGNLTITQGILGNPASPYVMSVTGDFNETSTGTLGGANLTMRFAGTGTQNLSKSAGTFASKLDVTATGAAKVISTFQAVGQTCTVSSGGTLRLNGQVFSCATGFSVASGGTLQLQGAETPTAPTLNSGSTVRYVGDGDGAVDAVQPRQLELLESDRQLHRRHHRHVPVGQQPHPGGGDVHRRHGLDQRRGLLLAVGPAARQRGDLDTGRAHGQRRRWDDLLVGDAQAGVGDRRRHRRLHRVGVHVHRTDRRDDRHRQLHPHLGHVHRQHRHRLVDRNEPAGHRQHDLLQPDQGGHLGRHTDIRRQRHPDHHQHDHVHGHRGEPAHAGSSSGGVQWKFDPQGTRWISYVSVSYSNNLNSSQIVTIGNNITDGGNNTGWLFASGSPNSPTGLAQKRTNDTTISVGEWISDTSVKFTASASDPTPATRCNSASRRSRTGPGSRIPKTAAVPVSRTRAAPSPRR